MSLAEHDFAIADGVAISFCAGGGWLSSLWFYLEDLGGN